MGKDEVIKRMRNHDDVEFNRTRFDYLVDDEGMYWRRAAALFLTEQGYSHSGMAKMLDVTDSTAKGYLEDIEEEYGELATQAKPKPEKNERLWP